MCGFGLPTNFGSFLGNFGQGGGNGYSSGYNTQQPNYGYQTMPQQKDGSYYQGGPATAQQPGAPQSFSNQNWSSVDNSNRYKPMPAATQQFGTPQTYQPGGIDDPNRTRQVTANNARVGIGKKPYSGR